jgi:malonate-semialdehyde dehydrogenase (acetylating)/methylmalonate-semialdehyde dehydrogenase
MIGVNIGVPVPREPFAFGGWNESSFGGGDITGDTAVSFWTKQKKITTKWSAGSKSNWMS